MSRKIKKHRLGIRRCRQTSYVYILAVRTPSYPRRLCVGAKNLGRFPGLWSSFPAPSHTECTVDMQVTPIYSGGTALDLNQLPY